MSGNYREVFERRGHLYNRANSVAPAVRDAERRLLLDLLDLERVGPGEVVVDVPAGGGYAAEGIAERAPAARIVCVEPSPIFAAGIRPGLARVIGALENLPLATGGAARVASLAGLHHARDTRPFFAEARRVLAPGGRAAVADVVAGTPVARFLDDVVDRLSETGHRGFFVAPGEMTRLLADAGFEGARERHERFTWDFDDEETMRRFCRDLFGLTRARSLEEVGDEVRRHLEVEVAADGRGRRLAWSLVYASGEAA